VLCPLNAVPSSISPVSELFLARSSDRVELLVGFPPILFRPSMSLSIVDIFLIDLFNRSQSVTKNVL
jgi:hypothetical protein